jgi:hypothetical protein
MEKLFGNVEVRNSVKRNGFDLSNRLVFTAKAGELLPVFHKSVLPGDKFHLSVSHFTRTSPVETASFTRIKEYFDWFFVPYRQLWKSSPAVLTQNTNNPTVARSFSSNAVIGTNLPFIPANKLLFDGSSSGANSVLGSLCLFDSNSASPRINFFGFNRGVMAAKLLNHLGYNYTTNAQLRAFISTGDATKAKSFKNNVPLSLFPLAAYQKIYYDYYRNTQWENMVPYNYNFDYLDTDTMFPITDCVDDYWSNPTLFDLRYANYPKDIFMGLLPNSQQGDVSLIPTHMDGTKTVNVSDQTSHADLVTQSGGNVITPTGGDGHKVGFSIDDAFGSFNFSILDFRKANMLQKYKEIVGSGSQDYQDLIKRVFDVDVPDTLADHCTYLGGDSSIISINEVVNQNLSTDTSQPDLMGNGTGSNSGTSINFNAQEHGVLMCIYHACPIIDYSLNAYNFDVTKTAVGDFANPVFDSLGYQALPSYYLDNSPSLATLGNLGFLGYTTRYFDYKCSLDNVLGDFKETLKNWIAPLDTAYLNAFTASGSVQLNYNFFQINPHILDSIFFLKSGDYVDTDQLRVSAQFAVTAVRNLSYTGMPY